MVVGVCNEKGGSGKTTFACNIAIMRALAGRDVLLVDADPQASSSEFVKVREDLKIQPAITCVSILGRAVASEVRKLIPRYQDIIIDAGGRDNAGLRAALVVSDVLIVPFLPGQFDIWGLENMDNLLEDALVLNPEMNPIAVLNKMDSNPRIGLAQEASEMVNEMKNLRLSSVRIGYRVAYRRSAAEGRAVSELDRKDQKAISELEALYKEVFANAQG
jgi:chromosome partitioning protein